jgi:hypothetical protein
MSEYRKGAALGQPFLLLQRGFVEAEFYPFSRASQVAGPTAPSTVRPILP